jgi:hypothetical protein
VPSLQHSEGFEWPGILEGTSAHPLQILGASPSTSHGLEHTRNSGLSELRELDLRYTEYGNSLFFFQSNLTSSLISSCGLGFNLGWLTRWHPAKHPTPPLPRLQRLLLPVAYLDCPGTLEWLFQLPCLDSLHLWQDCNRSVFTRLWKALYFESNCTCPHQPSTVSPQ